MALEHADDTGVAGEFGRTGQADHAAAYNKYVNVFHARRRS
jgi:hypothetical protein